MDEKKDAERKDEFHEAPEVMLAESSLPDISKKHISYGGEQHRQPKSGIYQFVMILVYGIHPVAIIITHKDSFFSLSMEIKSVKAAFASVKTVFVTCIVHSKVYFTERIVPLTEFILPYGVSGISL